MKRFLSKYAEWVIIVVIVLALLFVYYVLPMMKPPVKVAEVHCKVVVYSGYGNVVEVKVCE